jgi:hypothetical protein
MASRKEQKERARQQRLAAEAAAAAKAARTRRLRLGGIVAAAAIVAAVIAVAAASSGGGGSGTPARVSTTSIAGLGNLQAAPSPGPLGAEAVPIPQAPALASTASAATGQPVNGVQCGATEQTLFHVHTHLTIFVNGQARQVPYGIGIPPPRQVQQSAQGPFVASGTCFYWLHTHAADGIVHIESPVRRTFTLGDFFALWGQPLGPDQVGPATGKVTAFYNGALYRGNPRNIPLGNHVQIQLDVGSPLIAPEKISFAGTQL